MFGAIDVLWLWEKGTEVQFHLKVNFSEGEARMLMGPSERDMENQSVLPKHYAVHGSH